MSVSPGPAVLSGVRAEALYLTHCWYQCLRSVVVNCIGAACDFNVDSRHFDRRILHAGASKMVDFHLTDTYCIGSWIAIPNGRFGKHSSFWIVIPIKSMNIIILGVG